MNPDMITREANPVADTAYADAWRDAEGRATFEHIIATERDSSRSRRRVAWRLAPIAAGVAVAVAAVAVVVLGGSDQHRAVTHTRPAAWTVTENPDGTVSVWFQDYRDPAGLQQRLRAAGVRANVTTLSESCYPRSTGQGRYGILMVEPTMNQADVEHLFPFTSDTQELSVDPSYLPADDTIWVGFPPDTAPAADQFFSVAVQATDDASVPCPLQVARSNQPGQQNYLVAPGH